MFLGGLMEFFATKRGLFVADCYETAYYISFTLMMILFYTYDDSHSILYYNRVICDYINQYE